VRMPELVGREPAASSCRERGVTLLAADAGRRAGLPRVGPRRSQNNALAWEAGADLEPRLEVLESASGPHQPRAACRPCLDAPTLRRLTDNADANIIR
jgi:hypothetical protein